VLGYSISSVIQAFVPKRSLTKYMGGVNAKSVSLSTLFGAISSSCSFAALATARSLFTKGAHFVAAVAFMFASTNLVIELGILIYIFLGWEFVVAEIIGGLLLISISSVLIKLFYPKKWVQQAREKLEASAAEAGGFDWKKRIRSKEGWWRVGSKFVMEWQMAWEDILIGFTVAGLVSVVVPASFWETIFLMGQQESLPLWLIKLENVLVAPFVAAATFIGSMGNIPLATVLNANGVLFAGLMGFIYSDLMVPPLVNINRKYYGTRLALYIAGMMYVSIVITALLLDLGFSSLGILPEGNKEIEMVTRFKIDYTFWLNIFFVLLSMFWVFFHQKKQKAQQGADGHGHGHGHHHHGGGGVTFKRVVVYLCILFLSVGLGLWLFG